MIYLDLLSIISIDAPSMGSHLSNITAFQEAAVEQFIQLVLFCLL